VDSDRARISIGIVTALPIENLAIRSLIPDLTPIVVPRDVNHYHVGSLPSRDPARPHLVAVGLQARDGTRDAAALTVDMTRTFPGLRTFVMCGIAAGIPSLDLGDIVVATDGIVDYGHVRRVDGVDRVRGTIQKPAAAWLRADRELQVSELSGARPWVASVENLRRVPPFPPPVPAAPARVHRGAVGSADLLLRDARSRDDLARGHGLLAFEMEGSGVGSAAYLQDLSWFMVRGIADHGDNATKNDQWHPYASLVAAAYVEALLAECLPFDAAEASGDRQPPSTRLNAIVDGLQSLPIMRDDFQRRSVLAQLPGHIRVSIPDSVIGRLHLIGVVSACEQFPAGRDALLDVLRTALGSTSPEFGRIEKVIVANWSGR
jgi:nucleoside phosphorylase